MGLVLSQVEEGWVWLLRKQEGENPPLLYTVEGSPPCPIKKDRLCYLYISFVFFKIHFP